MIVRRCKIRKIGNSYGIILPRPTLNAMRLGEGDFVDLTLKVSKKGRENYENK